MTEKRKSILYCCKRKKGEAKHPVMGKFWYADFSVHPKTAQLYQMEGDVLCKVRVREAGEGEESAYWGWWAKRVDSFVFVFPTRSYLSICFPYGIEAEEEAGHGECHRVTVEELGVIDKEELAKWEGKRKLD